MKEAIIIGGGIAGLSTAIALQQIGFKVKVYESAPEIKKVGAGIIMASNAMQVFSKMGFAEKVVEAGMEVDSFSITDHQFNIIQKTAQGWMRDKYGYGIIPIHRGDLQKVLIDQLGAENLFLGRHFVSYSKNENQVKVEFERGEVVYGDLLIGADGIHSNVRKNLRSVIGLEEISYRYCNQTCWRGVAAISSDNNTYKNGVESWGNKRRFGVIQINPKQVYWFAVQTAPPGGKDNKETIKEDLLKLFQDFDSRVNDIIELTPDDKIIRNDLYDFKPLKRWHHENVCLIGDAAHATTPNMGQGGCQAVEDAWALQQIFRSEEDCNKAFSIFQKQRIKKTSKITNQSFSIGKMAHSRYGKSVMKVLSGLLPESLIHKQLEWVLNID